MGRENLLARRLTAERQAIRMRLRRMAHQTMSGFSEGQRVSHGGSPDVLERARQGLLKEQEARTCEILTSRFKVLDQAWKKLLRGTYGVCRLCGKDIPRKRLEAVPGATLCVSCQELME